MSCGIGINSFFAPDQYIKLLNSDIVAIMGPNIFERLIAGDIKMPYKQVLKGRIILKEGQLAYLLNFLGLGDNATFLAIVARYDKKSVNEEDNYLEYYYYDETNKIRYMDQMMILTGNSVNRIPQIYFNNPNTTYSVTLDVMVGVIDDTYTYFPDNKNQNGLSFYNIQCNSSVCNINTFIVNESIVIYDNNVPRNPLVYIVLDEISSLSINNTIITIDDATNGRIYLDFISVNDANQAFSLFNYISITPGVVIQNLSPIVDLISPVVYFYQHIGNTNSGSYIEFNGLTASAYDTSYGLTFSTSISLSDYGTQSGTTLTKDILNNLMIATVSDNRDGLLVLSDSQILIYDYFSASNDSIVSTGTYSLYFNVKDIAGNYINTNTSILMNITA